MGTGLVSLAFPSIVGSIRGSKVEKVAPADVPMMLDANTKLLDIRTEGQLAKEGSPLLDPTSVIHAPWMVVGSEGQLKKNERFEQDVLFSRNAQVNGRTTFIILDSQGLVSKKVAQVIAKLSHDHDIYTVTGGFAAWKKAGVPFSFKPRTRAHKESAPTLWAGPEPEVDGNKSATSLAATPDTVTVDVEPVMPAEILIDGWPFAQTFKPKIMDLFTEGYSLDNAREDVLAGLVVGVIALSLSMALGIASESTPAIGLYTAVVAGFFISLFGGSRVTIGGPTAAFIPIVVGVAHNYGVENLVVCTGMAGAMLVAMGVTGLGDLIKFIPRPVVTGFTAGIATYIFSTQIKDFLGLGVPGHLPEGVPVPSEFLEKIYYFSNHLGGVHLPSVALALGCFAVLRTWPASWAKVMPPHILAVVGGTGALLLADNVFGLHTGIETIGSHFGVDAIPSSLPMPHIPSVSFETMTDLVYPAFTIALLAAIESLLCARVSDGFINDRHNSNTELISQGFANMVSAAFGGLPATGALARTAASVRAGGRSPVSGMVAAITVLVIMLVASPVAQYIPLPALSAVLVMVAINMGEWENFKALPSWPDKDAQLFLIAFFLTVLQDVAVAMEFGMVAAVILFVQDVTSSMHVRALPPSAPLAISSTGGLIAATSSYSLGAGAYSAGSANARVTIDFVPAGTDSTDEEDVEWKVSSTNTPTRSSAAAKSAPLTKVPANAAYLEITGPLLFGAGDILEGAMEEMHMSSIVNAVVMDLSHVSAMDVSGLEVMEEELKKLRKGKKQMVLCGLTRQPLRMLSRAGFLDQVGRDNVCRGVDDALLRARALGEQVAANNIVSANGVPAPTSSRATVVKVPDVSGD